MSAQVKYNERSWAIDIISEINLFSSLRNGFEITAGGELGVKADKKTLFPDVILSGNSGILQGWELKLPDTSIQDQEFISNAKTKSELMGLTSFLLWNANSAELHVKNEDDDSYSVLKTWNDPVFKTRKDVFVHRSTWIETLHQILIDIEHFLILGTLKPRAISNVLDADFAIRFVDSLCKSDAEEIHAAALQSESLRNEIDSWAADFHVQDSEKYVELARINILNWVIRFTFCHYLSKFYVFAAEVTKIDGSWTRDQVQEFFTRVSATADFANVFATDLADNFISDEGWSGRLQLNSLLTNSGVIELPELALKKVLEAFSTAVKRKSNGQYSTPSVLAKALAYISLNDLTANSWDPCCGSGSIPRAMYEIKVDAGVSRKLALETTWASDKFQMPLQLTSVQLSDPQAISSIVKVFRANLLEIEPKAQIRFTDPASTNEKVEFELPQFSSIASNLPFIRFESLFDSDLANFISTFEQELQEELQKSLSRADMYAFLTIALDRFLTDGGRAAILVSNSWLGTEWGSAWQSVLSKKFSIRGIVKSGSGRWFSNSNVITTMIVIEKPEPSFNRDVENKINFVTTLVPIDEWDMSFIVRLKAAVIDGNPSEDIQVGRHTGSAMDVRRRNGFNWRSGFISSEFLELIQSKSVPVSSFFEVARGARRGWDDLFYPSANAIETIEPEFLKPMLKSSRGQKMLLAEPDGKAFCCTESLADLRDLNKTGALSWIKSFENGVNGSGKKLVEVLKQSDLDWYQMSPREIGDFAISMNPDSSLTVFRLSSPAFMNQRLIRLSHKSGSKDLLHALLNSCVGMMSIEFLGFGRGLGALDLSASRVSKLLRVLDPDLLSNSQSQAIVEAFKPLTEREFFPLDDELEQNDRKHFDKTVLSFFGLAEHQDNIYTLLKEVVSERRSVKLG